MGTPFVEVYDIFMKSIKSKEFADMLTPEQLNETLENYLYEACDLHFPKCTKDLLDRNDTQFNEELSGREKRIIALCMQYKWFQSNYLMNEKMLESRLTTKDYVLYSPAKQIDTIMSMEKKLDKQVKKEIKKYLWYEEINK